MTSTSRRGWSPRGTDELPDELGDAKRLSPWAVATRYDEIDATLDRSSAVAIAESAVRWARSVVDAQRPEPPPEAPVVRPPGG